MRIGAHVTISPKPMAAIKEAKELNINTIQIFTHNPRGWSFKEHLEEDLSEFRKASTAENIFPVVSHCNYLINLATIDDVQFEKSVWCLKKELEYCKNFGCNYFVLHVGKHKGEGIETGISQVIKGLNLIKKELIDSGVMLLLETVAGQGTEVGVDFRDLNKIIIGVDDTIKELIGVCLDTCHIFAAGYDVRNPEIIAKAIDDSFGINKLKIIHINDSKGVLGQKLDRHAHLGLGEIGESGLRAFVNHDYFKNIPLILETPWDDYGDYHRDLKVLRELKN